LQQVTRCNGKRGVLKKIEELTDRAEAGGQARSASDDDNKGRKHVRKDCARLTSVEVDTDDESRTRPQVYNRTLVERVEDFLDRETR
jgi:hypothetical protein